MLVVDYMSLLRISIVGHVAKIMKSLMILFFDNLFLWKSTRDNYNQPHSSHEVMIAFIVFVNFEMF